MFQNHNLYTYTTVYSYYVIEYENKCKRTTKKIPTHLYSIISSAGREHMVAEAADTGLCYPNLSTERAKHASKCLREFDYDEVLYFRIIRNFDRSKKASNQQTKVFNWNLVSRCLDVLMNLSRQSSDNK